YDGPEAVFDELGRATAGGVADYAGISYSKIEAKQGVAWPCPDADHEGTPVLFTERFPTASGRAKFHPVRHQPAAEEADQEYPLFLTTGRVLAHYQSGVQTRRVDRLSELAPEPFAEVHPATARRYGLGQTRLVELRSRRGTAVARLKVTADIRENTVFMPFHWGGQQAVNRLTNPALDPVSGMPEFKVCAVAIRPVELTGGN
ncbi:MAG: molybdopterin oxidoreductase family protein, partial [Chloroflexota bacterium]